MQPSSSTRATIVSAENQNGATIVKATYFFCHYYIVWESNNASEARGQSWNESLKSRWIPGGSCGYTSGTQRKYFAALSSPRPCWRWLQLQPSCGSPQWTFKNMNWFWSKQGLVMISIIKCGMKLLIHPHTSSPWSLGIDKSFNRTLCWACDYLSMLGLKVIRVSKRRPKGGMGWD